MNKCNFLPLQIAVFNGESRCTDGTSLVVQDAAGSGAATAAAAAAAAAAGSAAALVDCSVDARVPAALLPDDCGRRDWMHRLRAGDIVLVSRVDAGCTLRAGHPIHVDK